MTARYNVLAAVAVAAGLALGGCAVPSSGPDAISPDRIAQILASPDRSEADRTNDLRRKPDRMLAFLAIQPGTVALDLSAAGGYTTELVARAAGPTGMVYGQSRPPGPPRPAAMQAVPEGNSHPTAAARRAPPPRPHRRHARRRWRWPTATPS